MKFASNSVLMVPSGVLQKQTKIFSEEYISNTDLNEFSSKIAKNMSSRFIVTKYTRKQATMDKSYQK